MQIVSGAVLRIITGYDYHNTGVEVDTYSGVRFAADGNMYAFQAAGGLTNIGSWLVSGTIADYYVVSTIDSGTLSADAGRGPLQLNTNRDFYCLDTTYSGGSVTAECTFTLEDVGTTDFAGPTALSFSAFKTS